MSARRALLVLFAALVASAWSCSSDVSSGFETSVEADAPALTDVTFQPLDASEN